MRTRTSTAAAVTIAATLTVGLTALGGATAGAGSEPAAPPTSGDCDATVPDTQVEYGAVGPNAAFDPVATSGAQVGGTENAAVWDVLFVYDLQAGRVVPHLGESISPNDDHTVWTLKLRAGIEYSDGTPLDAQLVADNLARFVVPEGVRNAAAGEVSRIESTTVVDDLTLEITLKAPFAQFDAVLTDEPGEIVNLTAIGDDIDAFRVQPPAEAGLGPYVVERNVPGEETVLKAREDYWGGPVCIERLRFTVNPDAQATYDAFRNGELDVALLGDPGAVAQAVADGAEGYVYPQVFSPILYFNHREGYDTADPRIREAISLAIDPEVINDRAYEGNLHAGTTYFGDQSPFWSDDMQALELDPERAAQLVEEAKAEGFDGTISLVTTTSGFGPDTALAVEGLLGSIGITVEQQPVTQADQITRLAAGDWDMIMTSSFSGPDSGLLALVRYLRSDSPSNRMGYRSEAMDALLDEALATPYDELPPVIAEISNQLHRDFAMVNYGSNDYMLVADGVSGIVPSYALVSLFFAASVDDR